MSTSPRVLLIEDRESNVYLCRYILERAGFRVAAARSGPEGVRLARAEAPDLILLDLQMPGVDGYTTAAELREMPELAGTVIVALSACVQPSERERALASGCRGFIEKPIDVGTFAAQVRGFVSGGGAGGAGGVAGAPGPA